MQAIPSREEHNVISRVIYYAIATAIFYAVLSLFTSSVKYDTPGYVGFLSATIIAIVFGVYYGIKNHSIAKNYFTIVYSLAVTLSFLFQGGIFGTFTLDFALLLIFVTLIHHKKALIAYYIAIILTYSILIYLQSQNVITVVNAEYFSPVVDLIITMSTRLILMLILLIYVKEKYSLLIVKSQEQYKDINKLNVDLQETIENLKSTQKRLIKSEKMASLGVMTAGVAHEINNPLNFISGGTTLLDRVNYKLLDESSRDDLIHGNEMVKSGSQRINEIVSSLLTYSHKGSSSETINSINDIIDEAIVFIKPKLRDVNLKLDLKSKNKLKIHPERVQRVFINIIDNAIHELKKSKLKKLLIKSYDENNQVITRIENEGKPIPSDIIDNIFDPFFTTKEPGVGTGLGLSICQTIIEESRGTIEIDNMDHGVAFVITLPKA